MANICGAFQSDPVFSSDAFIRTRMHIVSCGVLLFNERQEIFLCHSTGNSWWDILKGGADPGESPAQAAVREAFEESGIVLRPEELRDLGQMRYYSGKDLHLFTARRRADEVNPADCRCTSFFEDPRRGGRSTPEVDDFKWVPFSAVATHCSTNMAKVLRERLDLAALSLQS